MISKFLSAFASPAKTSPAPTVPEAERPQRRRASDRPVTVATVRRKYERPRSITDHLPWREYVPEHQVFLMNDGRSVGALLKLTPKSTEGRDVAYIARIRDALEAALQDSFDELDQRQGQWTIQFYAFDDPDLRSHMAKIKEYVWPHAKGTAYTEAFLKTMDAHIQGISKPGGLFHDDVTDSAWRGKQRRCYVFIYRRRPQGYIHPQGLAPHKELNETIRKFGGALRNAGLACERGTGADFYRWMLRWFNPNPPMTDGDKEKFYALAGYAGPDGTASDDELPFGYDFADSLFYCMPRSDYNNGTWWFDGMPHRCVSVSRLRKVPRVGHTTAELEVGKSLFALFDRLPEDTIMAFTVVVEPQDKIELHISELENRSKGDTTEAQLTFRDCQLARQFAGGRHRLFRGAMAFYLRGADLAQLKERTSDLTATLLSFGLEPLQEQYEHFPLDMYLMHLPMCYESALDKTAKRMKLMFAQHIANLAPIYGRHTGTGNPCINFFNRGADLLCVDPFSMKDRKKNAHALLLGPTGAGKSATLTYLMSQIMGVVRPRLYIVEAGNSFGLLADYFESLGLSVNKVALKPGAGVSLPPFIDAIKLLEREEKAAEMLAKALHQKGVDDNLDLDALAEDDTEEDEQRDIMGEMEIIAMLMITGGEEAETAKFTRADRRMIREGILNAARHCRDAGRPVLTEDVATAIGEFAQDGTLPESRRARILDMVDAMRLFTTGMEGELFNRAGSHWPEVDVTLVDLATYAREGYGGQLAVAYTSVMMAINNVAEKYQNDYRPLLMVTDEGHIITTNPLLAPFVVKVVKMWRKLGAWWWVATQNMEDFPASAKKMLNMIEWWLCLVMPPEEVGEIARFKSLTPEQKKLLTSARKEPGKYTEGVILSENVEALFRNVPPSLYLALAMTEKDEKVERAQLMRAHQCSEVQAAIKVAERLDQKRGLL